MTLRVDHQGFTVYRIVRAGYPAFDGSGALRYGGRWTSPGRSVVHAAETYALAVLENLVHFNSTQLPPHMAVIRIDIPAALACTRIARDAVPEFDTAAGYAECRALGDSWHAARRTACLIVPSRLSPFEDNLVINPAHPAAQRLTVHEPVPALIDERLRS